MRLDNIKDIEALPLNTREGPFVHPNDCLGQWIDDDDDDNKDWVH